MKLITKQQHALLLKYGEANAVRGGDIDFKPVVKLFTPDAGFTWLLTEIDPMDHDCAFGLCDLGVGYPELGWVSLAELASIRGNLGLPLERDRLFEATHPISVYATAADFAGTITTNHKHLDQAAAIAKAKGGVK